MPWGLQGRDWYPVVPSRGKGLGCCELLVLRLGYRRTAKQSWGPWGLWGWRQALSLGKGQAWLGLPEVSFPAH